MQAKRTLLPTLLILILAVLALAACGGGGAAGGPEKTMFNLPSAQIDVAPDGSASFYGLPLSGVIAPAQLQPLVQQLQAAGAQQVQLRIGANGVHIFVNGEQLPYLAWDSASVDNLGTTLEATNPGLGQTINQLRQLGVGVTLNVPPTEGASKLDIPRWTGETSIAAPEAAPGPVIGPIVLPATLGADGSVKTSIGGLPLTLTTLDPNTIAMLSALGIDKLTIKTTPGGIQLIGNDNMPLPSLAYDAATLEKTLGMASSFVDPATAPLLSGLAPQLPNMDVTVNVCLKGQDCGSAQLPKELAVKIGANGALNVLGMDLPGAALPAATLDTLGKVAKSGVAIAATPESIAVSVDGQTLPKINIAPAGLDLVAALAAPALGLPAADAKGAVEGILGAGMNVALAMPGGEAPAAPTNLTFAPADLGDLGTPTIRMQATVKDGQVTSAAGLSAEQLAGLGVTLPTLPPAVTDIFAQLGAKTVDIVNAGNKLDIKVNGDTLLSLDHDQASLQAALNLAKPFLAGSPLEDPAVSQLISDQVLAKLPGTDLQITVNVE